MTERIRYSIALSMKGLVLSTVANCHDNDCAVGLQPKRGTPLHNATHSILNMTL